MRKITDYKIKKCKICGTKVKPTSGAQRYCIPCRKEKLKKLTRISCRKYYYTHIESEAKRKSIWYFKNRERIKKHQHEHKLKVGIIKK